MSKTDTPDTEPTKRRRTKITETAPQMPLPPSKHMTKAEKFWDYWRDVEKQFPDRTYAYVYRKWPVINRQLVDSDVPNSIDKINFMELTDFGKKWGNGDYNLILTDPYLARQGHKNIASTFFSIREPDNPPVLDYRELVIGDPANAEYIQQLRARGTPLPGDEENMTKETTAVLAGTIKDLVESRGTAPAADHAVTKGVVETITQAAKASNELMHETYAQATRVQFQQPDPVDALVKAATVFKTLMPQSSSGELFPVLLQMMKDNQAASMAQFQAQMEAIKSSNQLLREMLVNRPAAEPPAPTTASRLQERLEEKVLEDILNGGSTAKHGSGTDWFKVVQYALPAVTTIVGGVVAAFAPKAATPPTPHQTIQANPAAPTPSPTPQPQEENMYQQLLTRIAPDLLNHIDQGLDGADFADYIIQGHKRIVYDMVRQVGKDALLSEIVKHPALGPYVAQIPSVFDAFVDQFIRRDEIRAAEDAEEA